MADLELLDAVRGFTLSHLHTAGDEVFVSSNTPHGFDPIDDLIVGFNLWQAGDLRRESDFG